MTARVRTWCVGVCVAWAAGVACAQDAWELIGRNLRAQTCEVATIEGGVVTFRERNGDVRERPLGEFVAAVHLLPPAERASRELPWITRQIERFSPGAREDEESPAFLGRLVLTDGQVWVGTLLEAQGQSVSWFVEDALVMAAPLERIVMAEVSGALESEAREGWEAVTDRVVLGNGDRLDWFVDAIGERVVVEAGGDVLEFPLDRVRGVLLANPGTEPSGMVVRTTGGSVIAVDDLGVSLTGEVRAAVRQGADTAEVVLDGDRVRSVVFAPGAVSSLAAIEPAEVVPGEGTFGTAGLAREPDEAMGFDGLELRGPVTVRWEFARPARRFAAVATLPPAMWAWGDCEIVVSTAEGDEVLRERLWAERPRAEINVPLAGQPGLVVAVESGNGGAVQDRIVLTRPMIAW